MAKLGEKKLTLHLRKCLAALPPELADPPAELSPMVMSSSTPSMRKAIGPASRGCCAA